ncbi:hypothetical protein HDU98_005666, partial [Podochytrium sp. JEL0797]
MPKYVIASSANQKVVTDEDDEKAHTGAVKPEQSMRQKIRQKLIRFYQTYMVWFLIPAFDNKGRKLSMEQFDKADFADISFQKNGLHPKSYFNSIWEFIMS